MKRFVLAGFLLFLLAGVFLAGSWYGQQRSIEPSVHGARKILYYVDPMNPAHTSDKPGIAPCGMKMEPVYADGESAGQAPGSDPPSMPHGTANVSPEKQQIIGVRVCPVEKGAGIHSLRLLGRVAPDETRTYRLNAGIDGFIREISAVTTGSQVKKDQWLATFSAPDARSLIQAFLVTLDVSDRAKKGGADSPAQLNAANASIQIAMDRLLNLGMSGVQIEEIRRTREAPATIRIHSPAAGFVLARNVSPGMRFDRGTELYQIADLNRVLIVADVLASEAGYVRPGMSARVSLPRQGHLFTAKVTNVLPQADKAAPTLKVRLEMDNPGYALRPDMFVDVEFPVALPSALAVPADAILDSGLKKTVFVDQGNGVFEPRQVETGWRLGDRVEIVKGLMEGERIVVSGNFLIDSESRMKMAAAGMQTAPQAQHAHGHHAPAQPSGHRAKDPVCGMEVDAGRANLDGRDAACFVI